MALTKEDLDASLLKLKIDLTNDLGKEILESIQAVKDTVIQNLLEENEKLRDRVSSLEDRMTALEQGHHETAQYHRQQNLLITGIPEEVQQGKQLEGVVLSIMDRCNDNIKHKSHHLQGCHRLSPTSNDVVARFVNKKQQKTCSKCIRQSFQNEKLDLRG